MSSKGPRKEKVEKDRIQLNGKVVQAYRGGVFEVEAGAGDSEHTMKIMATLSGKMRSRYIRVTPGDNVTVEVSPYDLSRGRIVYRVR